jgi:hypothetical protein
VDTDENRRRVCTVSGEEFHQPGGSEFKRGREEKGEGVSGFIGEVFMAS